VPEEEIDLQTDLRYQEVPVKILDTITKKTRNSKVWILWQNRLNYSGSSALVIAKQPILTPCTSNGTTHWSVGLRPMQPWFNRTEAGLPRTKAGLQSHNSSPTFNPQHIKHYYKPFQTYRKLIQTLFETTS
jgi:hypothetical protein